MRLNPLGKTGLNVSSLSFGASSLGGVFRPVTEADAVAAVEAALEAGINYLDVAPAYGSTLAECTLGRALRGVPRDSYVLSTKVGKLTGGKVFDDRFNFSRDAILRSLDGSLGRLGVDQVDILHLHDIEYEGGRHLESALGEGLETLHSLKREGAIRGVSVGTFPVDVLQQILTMDAFDAVLIHNRYCLNDTHLLDLLPMAQENGVGIINASPFAMGLLSDREPPAWHPASAADRRAVREAADFCRHRGTSINKLALQFASQHPDVATTLFSSANADSVRRNVAWHEEPFDPDVVAGVQTRLQPLFNKDWDFGGWTAAQQPQDQVK